VQAPNASAANAGPRAGWYPDPAHVSHQRYWDGATWTDRTKSHARLLALSLSLASVAIPALIWGLMARFGNVSADTGSLSVVICMLGGGAASAGIGFGYKARPGAARVLAILASVIGGLFSLFTFFGLILAMALSGLSSGL